MRYGDARYHEVDRDEGARLSPDEIRAGWHFCYDWDEMLIGPEMTAEWACCACNNNPLRTIDVPPARGAP